MTTRCHLFKSIRVIMETANGKQVCLKNLPSNYHPMFSHTHKSKNIMLGFYSLYRHLRTETNRRAYPVPVQERVGLKEIQSDQNKPRNLKDFLPTSAKGCFCI